MEILMPVLETQRLRIRPFALTDLDAIHHALDFEDGRETTPLAERRIWLEWAVRNTPALAALYQPPYGDRAITLQATGEVIGACGLVPTVMPVGLLPYYQQALKPAPPVLFIPEVGLFWALDEAQRGRGYATEAAQALIDYAFQGLELLRIIATTEYTNIASQRVMQRLGMRIEQNPSEEPNWFQVVGILENPRKQAQ